MASTYTDSNGIEKISTGEQAGTWGTTTNTNLDILDRSIAGVGSISLSSTNYDLEVEDGIASAGHDRVITFTGSPGGACTVSVLPTNAKRFYFVTNNTDQIITMKQTTGSATSSNSVDIPIKANAIVYADGGGDSSGKVLNFLSKLCIIGDSSSQDFSGTPDDVLAIGASQDLKLYHDGSNSYINDAGTGNLKIVTSQLDILGTSETLATFVDDGAVTLYYNDTARITTTATGATVTGDLTISGDDLVMATNTSGHILVADGTNYNPVAMSGDVTINSSGVAAIAANSVALGTDTTGNYLASVSAGTGVTVSGSAGEGWTATVAIGQAVATSSNVTFNQVTSGSFLYSSDEELKSNIKTIEEPIEKVKQLRGVSYTWNKNSTQDGKEDIGLIAQEVEKVLPELVEHSDIMNSKTVNYGHLIGLLVEAVKEQQKQIDELKK